MTKNSRGEMKCLNKKMITNIHCMDVWFSCELTVESMWILRDELDDVL